MTTYWTWPELQIGDRFRCAGYDDLFVKVSEHKAMCLSSFGLTRHRLSKRGERVEFGPTMGGLILAVR